MTKTEKFMIGLAYTLIVVTLLNLICVLTLNLIYTWRENRLIEAEPTSEVVYAESVKFEMEVPQNASSLPIEAPEPEITPEVVYFDVPLDEGLQDHIFMVCEDYGIEPELVMGMIFRETDYGRELIGDSGDSLGLMQIQPKWHKDRMARLGCTDLLDPYQNVDVGIDFIAELINQRGSVEWALMAYNGGPSYANKMVKAGKVSEYVKIVLGEMDRLTR